MISAIFMLSYWLQQEPGAGHSSELPAPQQELSSSLAGLPTELGKKGAEIIFFKFVLPQAVHFTSLFRPGRLMISKTF